MASQVALSAIQQLLFSQTYPPAQHDPLQQTLLQQLTLPAQRSPGLGLQPPQLPFRQTEPSLQKFWLRTQVLFSQQPFAGQHTPPQHVAPLVQQSLDWLHVP
ncbi:MAG TPA: hypothetical protein VFN57_16205 [Thermomicrobiaceae bacterium]|nr:hypothetical protein [Thermomicrobiaceae bacterium]